LYLKTSSTFVNALISSSNKSDLATISSLSSAISAGISMALSANLVTYQSVGLSNLPASVLIACILPAFNSAIS